MKKKLLAMMLAFVMAAGAAVPALAEQSLAPEDYGVASDAWYYDAAAFVIENGIMGSMETEKNEFAGGAYVSRAQAFQTMYNMQGAPEAAGAASFADTAGKWYADSAAWAEEAGLAQGDGGLYAGDRSVTRAELAVIIYRYAKFAGIALTTSGSGFEGMADYEQVPGWAMDGMSACYYSGVINGKPGSILDPNGTATRAELATILMNLLGSASYKQYEVSIEVPETDGIPAHTIPAIVTVPVGEGAYPGVVMLHGTGSNKDEAGGGYIMAAERMAEEGIASIRFDFMGNGDSEAQYSDYNYTSASIDAKAAADYLAGLDEVKGDSIAVLGWSQGGTNAIVAAAEYPGTFNAVITWAGATNLQGSGLFPEGFDAAYAATKTEGGYPLTFDWRGDLVMGERWFEEVAGTDILKKTAEITVPILAINGSADTTVLPENAEKIIASAKNGDSELYLIDDCDHTFNVFSGDYTAIYNAIGKGIEFIKAQFVVEGTVTEIEKYGHALTDIPIASMPFDFGDILTVTFSNGFTVDAPYLPDYFVEQGEYLVRGYSGHTYVGICINYGNLGDVNGVAAGDTVTISLKEKGGYLAQYEMYQLERTNERGDYSSDTEFANFREITAGDIAGGRLYRSSSPINPELGRAAYADDLAEAAGIAVFINLANSLEELEGYFEAVDFDSPYYKSVFEAGGVIYLDMGAAYTTDDFKAKLGQGLIFMSEHEGPYLVHCNEGKDRAGFTSAVLEALMGATLDEIRDDYMMSYINYYGLKKGSDKYTLIMGANIDAMLCTIAGLDTGSDLSGVDLAKVANAYILSCGVTQAQIDTLKANLSA